MKSAKRVALVLLLLPALLTAQSKNKHTVPAAFNNARYIWVEAINGDEFNPRIDPDDRQAIADVEDALRHWKRYSLTASRTEADIIFIVRKGRLATVKVGIGTGPLNQPSPGQRPASGPGASGPGASGPGASGPGASVGGEVGSPDDMLEVHQLNTDGTLGALLWERQFPDGLNAPQVALIAQLKKAVEHDYPLNPTPPPAKP
jgi:hypothetical protein